MSKNNLHYKDINLQETHDVNLDILHGHYPENHNEKSKINEQIPLEISQIPNFKTENNEIEPYGFNDLIIAYVVETISCIIFMLIENYSQGDLTKLIFGLYILITILYPVSGANMNGCVSLALWYYEEEFVKVHVLRRFGYILLIQPLGIFLGQMISLGVIGSNLVYSKVHPEVDSFTIGFSEFLWTGCLIFTALHMIVSRYTRPTNQLGLNIAIFFVMLYFVSAIGGPYASGSYNPTKYLITGAIANLRGIEPNALKRWYCYVIPQYIGTILFTLLFKYAFEPIYFRMLSLKYKWEDKFYPKKY